MKKNEKQYNNANENIEELTPKKQEYPKGAIWTDGEVLNEKVIKEFNIEEDLKSIGISTSFSEKNLNTNNDNKMKSRVVILEDEEFLIRKSFSIRESTAQMLNELKFLHPNVNIRLNVLIDSAIRHYHEYIIERGGF
ncbi:hypothetical protein [Clostridium intestinale]|uniref:hypothetical protein n=1 Tax=Clostridium intestinale TaxID=36845 RepID=UPI002DD6B770|nr:hypothetical protein [Clostridium intestinale]WRY51319.1 hypothetical protein P8F83_22150 [Clostridium intestinale]